MRRGWCYSRPSGATFQPHRRACARAHSPRGAAHADRRHRARRVFRRCGFGSAMAQFRPPLLRGRHPHLGFAIRPVGLRRAQPHRRPDVGHQRDVAHVGRGAPLFLGERLTARRTLGLAIGIVGVALVTGPGGDIQHRTGAGCAVRGLSYGLAGAYVKRKAADVPSMAWPSVRSLSPGSFSFR